YRDGFVPVLLFMRLQSFLSQNGVASRRKCAEIILAGEVRVNGKVASGPGDAIDPEKDEILYQSKPVRPCARRQYFLFHKPLNVITTARDTHARKTVVDFFKGVQARLFPVGRLDRNTTGILLLTDDGELANRLMHPRHGVLKRYAVLTDSPLSSVQLTKFSKGVQLGPKRTAECGIRPCGKKERYYAYEVTLAEGQNRQIRRMMTILGKNVKALHRFEYGPLVLGRLEPGKHRPLTAEEVAALRQATQTPGGNSRGHS
ncbi:MAG: rRNA pseudouridine synthase, partial [Candidatus Omnitrophica bacterium]|nr:rRNA pseudouridine synthase [Candidatus Omnitrophota bacterium]